MERPENKFEENQTKRTQLNRLPVHAIDCIVTQSTLLSIVAGTPVDAEDDCSVVAIVVALVSKMLPVPLLPRRNPTKNRIDRKTHAQPNQLPVPVADCIVTNSCCNEQYSPVDCSWPVC